MNFWDDTHPLTSDCNRLFDQLVPAAGACDTVQGELLRAANKIAYDWYNNGWGCNNWSGAVVYLERNAMLIASKRTDAEREQFRRALRVAEGYSHGEPADISDKAADITVTTILAFVVQNILDNPTAIVNTVDMYDLQEPDAPYRDDEEDDDYEW